MRGPDEALRTRRGLAVGGRVTVRHANQPPRLALALLARVSGPRPLLRRPPSALLLFSNPGVRPRALHPAPRRGARGERPHPALLLHAVTSPSQPSQLQAEGLWASRRAPQLRVPGHAHVPDGTAGAGPGPAGHAQQRPPGLPSAAAEQRLGPPAAQHSGPGRAVGTDRGPQTQTPAAARPRPHATAPGLAAHGCRGPVQAVPVLWDRTAARPEVCFLCLVAAWLAWR